ncbi:MAG: four helix bundle protein [Bdellovibrionales bacterium]|nr:four helix bundle protein [Bdellovibrionales bacterium]
MKNFRTFQLAVKFNRECRSLKLRGSLRDQLLRASESVALNLAEGRGKPSVKDQKRFFSIAFGSVRECQAVLTLEGLETSPIGELLDSLAAHTFKLIQNC